MSWLNRIFRAGLALVLITQPALAGDPAPLRAAPEGSAAGKAGSSAAEAELNAVDEDDLMESPLAGKENRGTRAGNGSEEDAADRLAALELDEREVDDDAEEDPAGLKEVLETEIEAELDSEQEVDDEAETAEAD